MKKKKKIYITYLAQFNSLKKNEAWVVREYEHSTGAYIYVYIDIYST